MADFDLDLQYHPEKMNVVPDVLSRKPSYMMLTQQRELWAKFERLNLEVVLSRSAGQCMPLQVEPSLMIGSIGDMQGMQSYKSSEVESGLRLDMVIHEDNSLQFGSRLCVPTGGIRQELLTDAHSFEEFGLSAGEG